MTAYEQMDQDELGRAFVAEMKQLMRSQREPITLQLAPHDAFTVISLIQLACRHPELIGTSRYPRTFGVALVGQLAGLFDQGGAIAESIKRGWEDR